MMKRIVLFFLFLFTVDAQERTSLDEKNLAVIEFLQQSKKTDFKIADTDVALDLFHELANCFKQISTLQTKKPWKVHLTALVDLASVFLNLSQEIPSFENTERLMPFFEDLNTAYTSKSAHYEWFITFIDALSIANTPRSDWFDSKENTINFDVYRAEIIRQTVGDSQYIRPEIYRQKITSIGNTFTRKFASTKGASHCFPDIVILPFPFALSDENIVNSIPTPQKALWPAGFNLSSEEKIDADGESMSRHKFFSHDVHAHFAIYRSMLSTTIHPSFGTITIPQKNSIFILRNLFFECVTVAQDMIRDLKKKEAIDSHSEEKNDLILKRRLTSFFSFLLLHEMRYHIETRLKGFVFPEYLNAFLLNMKSRKVKKIIINPCYYQPLLPLKWQSNTRSILKRKLLLFGEIFLKDFAHQAQLSFPHGNLIENLKKLKQKEYFLNHNREIIFFNKDQILFDPSAYQLPYSLEHPIQIEFADQNPQNGYIRPLNKAVGEDTFGYLLSNNSTVHRFTYFDVMTLNHRTPDKEDQPDLIEVFVSAQHDKAQYSSVFSAGTINNINTPIDDHQNTALMWAIATQNIHNLKMLLNADADVNHMNIFGIPPLFWAIYEGNTEILEELLIKRANINITDPKKNTALHIAVQKGDLNSIKCLLKYGINIKQKNAQNMSATRVALHSKKKDTFQLLLEKDRDLDQKLENGESLFMSMIQIFPDLAIDTLDTHQPHLCSLTTEGITPLILAIAKKNANLVCALIQHGAPINQETTINKSTRTPLTYAIQCGYNQMVKLLIELGADINYIKKDGTRSTPVIFTAIAIHNNPVITLLIDKGVNLKQHAINKDGDKIDVLNAYLKLKEEFNIDTFKHLLANGAPIHECAISNAMYLNNIPALNAFFQHGYKIIRSNDYYTPFFMAARDEQYDVIDLFLAYGETISGHDLIDCIIADRLDVLERLFIYKPNLNQRHENHTLLSAIINSTLSPERKESFIRASVTGGANINYTDPIDPLPALFQAIRNQDVKLVKLLLSLGANPVQDQPSNIQTCLMGAIEQGQLDIIEELLKAGTILKSNRFSNNFAQAQAIVAKKIPVLSLLLSYGMGTNNFTLTDEKYSPLHYFVLHKHLEGVKLYLNYGASLTAIDKNGMTALDLAKYIATSENTADMRQIIDCITQKILSDRAIN